MIDFFAKENLEIIIHLAAQAGVRYSVEHPEAYVDSNLVGFANILEGARTLNVKHLLYASSSSVYGGNKKIPFAEGDGVDCPVSFYAATKKANELMAHSYSNIFGMPSTGLRFFTVYGPWGRPDMALFLFAKNIIEGKPINVFNHGNHTRDFTFVDDIANGVVAAMDHNAQPNLQWDGFNPDPATSKVPWRVYNIGNNQPVKLMRYIEVLEDCLGKKAELNLLPLQPGDVPDTYASVDNLVKDVGYKPATPVEEGVRRFVDWYRAYYNV
jgi:UDP-glucuronate 4-epimerase